MSDSRFPEDKAAAAGSGRESVYFYHVQIAKRSDGSCEATKKKKKKGPDVKQ